MVGAENREFVTCYLDALLFAMYAKLEAFDCMLKNEQLDENQRNLAALIRLWVNMLRSGKLIRTDMVRINSFFKTTYGAMWSTLADRHIANKGQTETIQNALASCGWQEARELQQQDTSEAFAFITETLQLPLLTLQVDLFHQGERDADDHKVVYERLLNLAVPPDPEGKGVQLEDCLEDYFNTRVDVLRDSLQDKQGGEKAALLPQETVRVVSPSSETGPATTPETTVTPEAEAEAEAEAEDAPKKNTAQVISEDTEKSADVTDNTVTHSGPEEADKVSSTDSTTATDATKTTTDSSSTDSIPPAVEKLDTSGLEPATITTSPTAISPSANRNSEEFDHDPAPMVRRWTSVGPDATSPESPAESSSAAERRASSTAATPRQRSASIIQRIVIEDGKPSEPQEASTLLQQFKRQGSTIMKAVTIPAWQFFRLIRESSFFNF